MVRIRPGEPFQSETANAVRRSFYSRLFSGRDQRPEKPAPRSDYPNRVQRHIRTAAAIALVSLALAPAAHASGSSMPWVAPLQSILESIEGPVAKIIAVIIITGLTLAFGDTSGGFRRLIQIVFGLSIAFAASSFFVSFFSFGGGALV
ncbi:conjugal transfer protein TrbC [Sphingomonas oleivorans]|uniref:Conjugal transfer protein TrbC n=1 Tax=Sphingomonas oleivorans TaxID=1735121 RepID=A0A2T5FWM4_9SPHN|nr:conjugal transfer protein TrbC [Sphingomonas oleivorans]